MFSLLYGRLLKDRSSRPEVLCKKSVLRNFAKFTGKYLCQRLLFNKVAGWPATLLKRSLWHRCFPGSSAKFLRTFFLQNTSGGCFYKEFNYLLHYILLRCEKIRNLILKEKIHFQKKHQAKEVHNTSNNNWFCEIDSVL